MKPEPTPKPLLFVTLAGGVEMALTLTAREEADATHIAQRAPTAEEVVETVRILEGGLLTDSRISTRANLEPRIA